MSSYSESSFGLPYEDGRSRMVKQPANDVRIIEPNPFGETVPHEDMFIFVSLTAKQKSKTLLTQEDDNRYSWDHRPANTVDLIAPQRETIIDGSTLFKAKPNLTTEWTEIGGHKIQLGNDFEGFGITNVDIEIKSQTSPKVVIDFVDIRGATLFEQGSCSPYGLFFNLPYPIFELTAKGYYGKPVKYYLNLVKFNTKFNSDTGNMECRAEFIGYSFAFLSDTIVGYVGASQYLKKDVYHPQEILQKKYNSTFEFYKKNNLPNFPDNPSTKNPWCNNPVLGGGEGRCFTINDLLARIKEFDTVSKPQIASSPEFNRLNNLTNLKNTYEAYRDLVYDFCRKLGASTGVQPTYTKTYEKETENLGVSVDALVSRFEMSKKTADELLKEGGLIDTYFNKKSGLLPINIKIVKTTKISDNEYAGSNLVDMLTGVSPLDLEGKEGDECPGCSRMYDKLAGDEWQNLMTDSKNAGLAYTTASKTPNDTETRFIDMGYIIKDINRELTKLTGDDGVITTLKRDVIDSINQIVEQVIGFKPTIRNIFTVILCNTDAFMEILLKVAHDAEEYHQGVDYSNTPPFNEIEYSTPKPKLFAWPTYYKRQFKPKSNGSSEVGSSSDQGTKEAFPGENTNFLNWKEVRFVEDFLDAFLEYQREIDILNDKKEGKPGYDNYVPINPLESPLWNDNNPNKYLGLVDPRDVYTVIGERLFIALDHTYFSPIRITPDAQDIPFIGKGPWNGLKNSGDNIATVIANIDAWNLLNSKEGESAQNEFASLMTQGPDKFISDVITALKDKYPNELLGVNTNGADGSIKASAIKRGGLFTFNSLEDLGFDNNDNYIVFKPKDGIRLNPTSSRIPIMIKPNPFDMGIENLFKIIEGKDGDTAREIKILPEDGDFSKAVDNYEGELTRRTNAIKFGNQEFGSNGGDDVTIELDKKQKIVGYYDPRLFTTLAMADAQTDKVSDWWTRKDLSNLSVSNMGLLSYWDDQGNNEVFGISLFNPDDSSGIEGLGVVKQTTKLNLGGSDSVDLADDVNGDGVSTPFITTPLWLDNIIKFRGTTPLLKPTQPFIINHQGTSKSISYTNIQIQNRNLAYLFLHTTKSTPLISRYVTDNGKLFSNEDGEDVGMDSASAVYSLKAFNITGGVTKVPKIWALTLGAQLWRWKMFVGTKSDGSWNRPLNCKNCGAGDIPTGFDPLAQPGFNSFDGGVINDIDRNSIYTYMSKIYGTGVYQIQKSSFISDYMSAGSGKGQKIGSGDWIYFDYYNAYKNKIGEDKITENLIGTNPNDITPLHTNYNWPQLWISPHHIPYVSPEIFNDKDDSEGTGYVQLFRNSTKCGSLQTCLDYHSIMHNSRTGLPYYEGDTPTNSVSDKYLTRSRTHDGNLGMVIQHLPDSIKDEFIYLFDTWCNDTWPDLLKTVDPVNFSNDPASKLTSSYIFSKDISMNTLANGDHGNVAIVLSDKNDNLKKLYNGLEGQYWILNSTPKLWYGIDSTNDTNSDDTNKFYDGFVVSDKIFKDYLTQFYTTFTQNRTKKIQEINKKLTEERTSSGESTIDDDDIKLSLYRTFKSLTDKWISASDMGQDTTKCGDIPSTRLFFNITDNGRGPNPCSNGNGDKPTLAAHFQYVNRVMGDIGDKAVIDLTKLNDLKDNIKISLYQYLSDVLTDNEYMFFPLPSFVNFTAGGMSPEDLEEMFKPVLSLDKVSSGPLFLSMYVGGSSRQLKYKGSANCPDEKKILQNFEDDSWLTSYQNDQGVSQVNPLAPEEVKDPKLGDPNSSANFTSFNVVYGIDTQNHFKNIQLDQAEFSETAESLMVIDKLSKQGGTDQTTKGQNLNSVYLTRSYSCQVESLGNMMIQPMTYFDLIGVPMFQGAYLITEVRHNFKPNSSSTTFKGTRQPRATVPIVIDAATAMNMSFKDMKTDGSGPSLNTVKQNTVPSGTDGTSSSLNNGQTIGQTVVGSLSDDTFVVNYKTGVKQPWLKKENGGLLPNQNGNRVLVPVKGYGAYTDMFHEAADAWMAMGERMKLDTGVLIAKTGNGYRTADTQAKLRTANGCPDLTSRNPSPPCRVQTAPLAKASDGTTYSSSNHGYGMANDTATFKGDAIYYGINLPSGKGKYSTSSVCAKEAKDNGYDDCTSYALAQAKTNSAQYLSGGKLDLPKVKEFYASLPDKPNSAQLRTVNDLALLWMQENARDYGWYPLSTEPWHYEYQLQPDNGHPKFKSQFTGKIKNGDQYNLVRSTGYPDLNTLNKPIMNSPSALATTPTTPGDKVLGDSPSTAKDYILNKSEWKGTGLGAVMASITQKEGWIKNKGRAYPNNNPGNLRYSDTYKAIDPNVVNNDNFCKFSSDLLGLRALSDYVKKTSKETVASGGAKKICGKNDAYVYNGVSYPSNALTRTPACNGTSSGVPSPSIYEYFYVYAPPTDSNNPRNYAEGVVKNLNGMGLPATIDTPIEKVLTMKV